MLSDRARVVELLEPLDPAGDEPVELDHALLATVLADPGPRPPRRRANRRRIVRPVIAAGCVVVVALVAAQILGAPDSQPRRAGGSLQLRDSEGQAVSLRAAVVERAGRVPRSAGAILADTAARVARNAGPDGPVVYSRTAAGYLNITGDEQPWSVGSTEIVESWVAPDGSGRIRHTVGPPQWPSEEDRRRGVAAGIAPPDEGEVRNSRFASGELTMSPIPADPERLLQGLERRAPKGSRGTGWVFNGLHELLVETGITTSQQATVLEALSMMEGIEVSGAVEDQLGRPGVALGVVSDYGGLDTRYELIVDPEAGKVLQFQAVLLEPVPWAQADPPLQLSFELYLDRHGVDEVGTTDASQPS